ncbi:MAG: globin domain-containing protein [Porticoccaceae bacterium]
MDPSQIALLRRTHTHILPGAAAFGAGFYRHLFAQDPALRKFFPDDIDVQAQKLMDMIQALLARLDQPETLAALCVDLGLRHRAYGTDETHYDLVGIALLRALRDTLGADYTEAVEAAWAGVYGEMAEAMIAAQQCPASK